MSCSDYKTLREGYLDNTNNYRINEGFANPVCGIIPYGNAGYEDVPNDTTKQRRKVYLELITCTIPPLSESGLVKTGEKITVGNADQVSLYYQYRDKAVAAAAASATSSLSNNIRSLYSSISGTFANTLDTPFTDSKGTVCTIGTKIKDFSTDNFCCSQNAKNDQNSNKHCNIEGRNNCTATVWKDSIGGKQCCYQNTSNNIATVGRYCNDPKW